MGEWAAGARAVFAVIQLPLNGVEEQVPSRLHINPQSDHSGFVHLSSGHAAN